MLSELFSLAGKKALVTGASRGLGRSMALAFAGCGADVALLARTKDALDEAAGAVRAEGREALVVPADVTRPEQVREAFASVRASWGGLDILVNNAGTNVRRKIEETRDEDWDAVLRTNLDSAFLCSREAIPLMQARGGSIINIGSVAGHVAIPTGVAYAASKGALSQMTRSLSQELADRAIRVNCIAPWYFRTELTRSLLDDPAYMSRVLRETPLGRVGEAADMAGVAVFLASPAAAYVTGQTLAVDGGMTVSRFRS